MCPWFLTTEGYVVDIGKLELEKMITFNHDGTTDITIPSGAIVSINWNAAAVKDIECVVQFWKFDYLGIHYEIFDR